MDAEKTSDKSKINIITDEKKTIEPIQISNPTANDKKRDEFEKTLNEFVKDVDSKDVVVYEVNSFFF
jgi:hypothetical protein